MTRQNTVNYELDKVEGTCWRTYIAGVSDLDTSDGDVCTIGILLTRFYLAYNHGVANFFSSVLGGIFKTDDAEGVSAFNSLVLEAF